MYRKEVKAYAKDIKKQRKSIMRNNIQKHSKFWDYPACISICYSVNRNRCSKGYSHSPSGTIWFPTLERKMSTIGIIGYPTAGCGNILGNCAEQHSANNYMNSYNEPRLANLYFSPTIRPRTGQVIDACGNCENIFPNL